MGDHQKSGRRKKKGRGLHRSDGGGGEHNQQTSVSNGNAPQLQSQSSSVMVNNSSAHQPLTKSQSQPPAALLLLQEVKPAAPVIKQQPKMQNTSPKAAVVQNDKSKNTNLCRNIPVKKTDVKPQVVADGSATLNKVGSLVKPVKETEGAKSNVQASASRPSTDAATKLENASEFNNQQIPVENAVSAPTKSKAELKAERRALQEAQRAAKSKKDDTKGVKSSSALSSSAVDTVKPSNRGLETKKSSEVLPDKRIAAKVPLKAKSMPLMNVKLFSHLPPYERSISVIQAAEEGIHPAIVQLGLQYAKGIVCGSSARCTALIYAFLEVFRDFKTPESKDLSHALTSLHIEPSMRFLEKCRPVSVGMKVICKKIVEEVTNLPKDLSEDEAKKKLVDVLTNILEDDVMKAHVSIVNLAKGKITSDDVILTYGCSYIVKQVLTAAHEVAKFRVIVVDARPKLEGRSMLHYLTQQGIQCTYVLINAVAHVMKEATKVFLGAHALLANGYVMSRVGSSQVALVAKAFNRPVLVCCETYKFSELVQTDSFVFNELGNPDDLVETRTCNNPLSGWQDMKNLNILNLYYDVTPPDLVTVVINDAHLVPCTSVPVLLRVKPTKR